MFLLLYRKDLMALISSFKFSALLIVSVSLIVMSTWVLGNDYQRRLDTYTALADNAARQAQEYYIPARIVPMVHQPPSPLSIFVQGEEKRLGNSVEIRRWRYPVKASDSLTDNMLLVTTPSFDLLAIFTLIFSLFSLLLSYDAFSAEREQGTLKLVVLTGPRRPMIFLSKFLSGITLLALPLMFGLLASLLVLNLIHGIVFSGEMLVALVVMMLVGLLFSSVFLCMGLLASIIVRRSSTALVLALFLWSLLILLVPTMANNLAAALSPLPSPREISDFEQKSMNDLNELRFAARREKWPNAGSGWGSWNVLGMTPFLFDASPQHWRDWMEFIRFNEPLFQKRADQIYAIERNHFDSKRKQLELSDLLQSISPAFHLRKSLYSLASTGYHSHGQFLEAARRYRSEFLSSLAEKGLFTDNVHLLFSRREPKEFLDEDDWAQRRESYIRRLDAGENVWDVLGERVWEPLPSGYIPAFPSAEVMPDYTMAIEHGAVLTISLIVLFAAGFTLFIRYDVR